MNNNQPAIPIDVYTMVTNRIIELLETGTVPWRKPWTGRGLPRNAISKRPYHGINIVLLNSLEFEHNLFLTWNQIKELNASVLKGEKGQFIIFTKTIDVEEIKNEQIETKQKSMLRYYTVFNIDQCKDLPAEFIPRDTDELPTIPSCISIVEGMKNAPRIVHKKSEAFYYHPEDYVNMPRMKRFKNSDDYYGQLFHELVHSTGHESRLKREEIYQNPEFGTKPYSLEELVGEMGACYLRSVAGLPFDSMSQSADYIKGWLSVFRGDKKILIQAASRAQKAVEYILNSDISKVDSNGAEKKVEMGIAA